MKTWNDEELAIMLELAVFLTNEELALHLNRSYASVTSKLNKLKYPHRKPDENFRKILPKNITFQKPNIFYNTKTKRMHHCSKAEYLQYSSLELKEFLDIEKKI